MATKKKKVDVNSAYYLQKMALSSQKQLTRMSLNMQKKIQEMSNEATEKTQEFNATEASNARAWQKQMSDTAHQREVADLKAAGLNPVLSAGGSGGAQSYTTSSASAQAENPSSAISAMMSGLMSAITGLTSATMNASTGRYQADLSAKTQLESAKISAAAQKYQADKSYAAQVYNANVQYQIAMEKPQTNPFGIIDKYFGNNSKEEIKKGIEDFKKEPGKFIYQIGSKVVTRTGFKISQYGDIFVGKQLKKLGAVNDSTNRRLWIQAFIFGDLDSSYKLNKSIKNGQNHKKHGMQK